MQAQKLPIKLSGQLWETEIKIKANNKLNSQHNQHNLNNKINPNHVHLKQLNFHK